MLTFLLLTQLTLAEETKVMYFYSSACPASHKVEPYVKDLKNFWGSRINWTEYNFMKDEDLPMFEKYRIVYSPVAIVNCFNESFRIGREEIVSMLNQTITYCYSLEKAGEISPPEEKQTSKPFPIWVIALILFFGLIGLKNLKRS